MIHIKSQTFNPSRFYFDHHRTKKLVLFIPHFQICKYYTKFCTHANYTKTKPRPSPPPVSFTSLLQNVAVSSPSRCQTGDTYRAHFSQYLREDAGYRLLCKREISSYPNMISLTVPPTKPPLTYTHFPDVQKSPNLQCDWSEQSRDHPRRGCGSPTAIETIKTTNNTTSKMTTCCCGAAMSNTNETHTT